MTMVSTLLVSLALLAPSALAQVAKQETVIFQFQGNGTATTRPFHADGPWELQWEATSTNGAILFSAESYLVGQPEHFEKLLANTGGETKEPHLSGTAYHEKGGDYYLTISSFGLWRVRVVSVGH
jgi:hypothetical protein